MEFMHALYMIMFIASFMMIMPLLNHYKQNSSHYVMLFICIAVFNMGTMQLASSSTLEAAVYANQTIYLGASFIPFFAYMCVADLCHHKPNRGFKALCIYISALIFAFASSVDVSDLFYKKIELINVDGISFLKKEYGPMHTVYPAYIILIAICGLWLIISSFKKRRMISYITSSMLFAVMSVNVTIYAVERLTHSNVELLPFGYVIEQIAILFLLRRIRTYDITSISGETMTSSLEYGFVVCSARGRFAGADESARQWFPELNDLMIDYPISRTDTPFLEQLSLWMKMEKDDSAVFECGDKIIEAQHRFTGRDTGKKIHCIYLSDYTRQNRYFRLMKSFNKTLESEVNEKTRRLKEVQNDIIISMASIVENRDNNTGGHIKRTSDIVRVFVDHLLEVDKFGEIDERTADCIEKAAPLHDFGKIAIPDIILNKPGKFTDEEYAQMKEHSAKGAVIVERILQNSDDELFKSIAVNVAHYHHEKWDGTGYPSGLKGKEIPFEARVMALADVFDALVSKRVYKESFTYDKAFFIIEDSCGTHFDPELCKEFLACRPELEKLYNSYID